MTDDRPPLRIFLGHGASGTSASMRPWADGLRARGFDATAIDLPKRKAEDAVPALLRIAPPGSDVVVGGHSYGGRVASLAAAQHRYAGLLLLSYPLHLPGKPERLRTEHWSDIACPALLLSGDADQFAQVDRLRSAVPLIRNAELFTYPRVRHGLGAVLDDALDRAAVFLAGLRR
jgi:hypothetical protein